MGRVRKKVNSGSPLIDDLALELHVYGKRLADEGVDTWECLSWFSSDELRDKFGIENLAHRKKLLCLAHDGYLKNPNPAQVELFFRGLSRDFADLASVVLKAGIDSMQVLHSLTEEEMEEIGIKKSGHRRRIAVALKSYHTSEGTPEAAPDADYPPPLALRTLRPPPETDMAVWKKWWSTPPRPRRCKPHYEYIAEITTVSPPSKDRLEDTRQSGRASVSWEAAADIPRAGSFPLPSMPSLSSMPSTPGNPIGQTLVNKEVTYTKLETLGHGSFGEVVKARCNFGESHAIKVIPLSGTTSELEEVAREYELLKKLNNPFIVQVHEFFIHDGQGHIVMELMTQGSIETVMQEQKDGGLELEAIASYTIQVLQGLTYLHKHSIVHSDIKPTNILVDRNTVKLTDFGLSIVKTVQAPDPVSSEKKEVDIKCSSARGTVPYMSPLVARSNQHTKQSDIWALGCTVLEMATGEVPWASCGFKFEAQYIRRIGSCWETREHPPIPDMLNHPLMKSMTDFCKKCWTAEWAGLTCEILCTEPFVCRDKWKITVDTMV